MGLFPSAKKLRRSAKQQITTNMLRYVSNYIISFLNHLQNPAAQEPFLGSAFP